MMRRAPVFLVVAAALIGCGDAAVDACRAQCDKRDACGEEIDVAQCHEACNGSALAGDDACVEAQLALQQCQVALPCEQYLANEGCDDESASVGERC